MHLPPAVTFEVVRSRWQFFAGISLGALAIATTITFWFGQTSPARGVSLAAITVFCGWLWLVSWHRSPVGKLVWDGTHWWWSGFGAVDVVDARLCMDFQFCFLLRLQAIDGQSAWLFIDRKTDRRNWLALRRAVIAGAHVTVATDGVLH